MKRPVAVLLGAALTSSMIGGGGIILHQNMPQPPDPEAEALVKYIHTHSGYPDKIRVHIKTLKKTGMDPKFYINRPVNDEAATVLSNALMLAYAGKSSDMIDIIGILERDGGAKPNTDDMRTLRVLAEGDDKANDYASVPKKRPFISAMQSIIDGNAELPILYDRWKNQYPDVYDRMNNEEVGLKFAAKDSGQSR